MGLTALLATRKSHPSTRRPDSTYLRQEPVSSEKARPLLSPPNHLQDSESVHEDTMSVISQYGHEKVI